MDTKALTWVTGRDTGVSSMTIWSVMMGAVQEKGDRRRHDTPKDPDDFGRCYRLLEIMPEWRARLAEVVEVFPKWGPLVEAWDELEGMYREVIRKGPGTWDLEASTRMYERMRTLEDEGLIADGWERIGSHGWRKAG